MGKITTRLVLTGAHKGKTIILNGRRFEDGVLSLKDDPQAVSGLIHYYGRAYSAYPEGSAALEQAMEKDSGLREILERAKSKPSGVRPDEPTPAPAPNGGRDGGDTGGNAGSGAAEENSGAKGSVEALPTDTLSVEIRKALASLDPGADENWTQAGQPKIGAIAPAITSGELSRDLIETAWPGFDREKAKGEYEPRDPGALKNLEADLDL